ncbi:MAG TPA: hypothetical protein VGS62_09590 [Streptosporangiaceae bacterium]|nr:hypothetical protein [Streptosporangiaceae bacterium]
MAAGTMVLTCTLTAAARPSAQQPVTGITGFRYGVSAVSAADVWAVVRRRG